MRNNPDCDIAIAKAAIENPEIEQSVKEMNNAQQRFNDATADMAYGVMMEADMPAPHRAGEAYWRKKVEGIADTQARAASGGSDTLYESIKEGTLGRAMEGWELFKQMRVALMLSNVTTHIKNFTSTGGQATVVRPMEEAMGVVLSRAWGEENRRSFLELKHYGSGMLRAAQDSLSLLKTLGKVGVQKGAFEAADVRSALVERGYAPELAQGKQDIILNANMANTARDIGQFSEEITKNGVKYLTNALFGSQFSALQASDTAFKMVSHRAKVQQLLSREGFQKYKLKGEALDEYVATHWDEMSQKVKDGADAPPRKREAISDVEQAGITQAAEDTFTQTPQTQVGKFLTASYPNATGWGRVASESVQVIAPFRAIYVNLMRQSLSRRLMPFFDKKTMGELMGREGEGARQTALARVAGAWTLFAGTGALITQAGMKIHGPDEMDPRARQMMFEMHGKVGNTIQIGDDFYFPIDGLPPHLGFALGVTASGLQALEEMEYRYLDSPDEDRNKVFLRQLSPFISATTDGPWVKEYLEFINRINGFVQYGNLKGLGQYLTSISVSPMSRPDWMNDLDPGYDPYLKSSDGMVSKFKTDLMGDIDSYGYTRNMFGRKIMPNERLGSNASYPWYMAEEDLNDFFKASNYIRSFPSNIAQTIYGSAGSIPGTSDGYDDVPMTSKMKDKFAYYAGQSMISGMTLADEIRAYMNQPGIYDHTTKTLVAKPVDVNKAINKIYYRHRRMARDLVKYNPEFGVAEKQAKLLAENFVKNGGDEQTAQELFQAKMQEANQARIQLAEFF